MYCRFCGRELSADSHFCSVCGKGVEQIVPQRTEKSAKWVLPVIIGLCSMTAIWRNDFFLSYVFAAIGVIAVLILLHYGWIKRDKITTDAFWMSVVLVVMELWHGCNFRIINLMAELSVGEIGGLAVFLESVSFLMAEDIWGARELWFWSLLIVFLLLRSDTIKIQRYGHLAVLLTLIAWNAILMLILRVSYFSNSNMDGLVTEYVDVVRQINFHYLAWVWLRRFCLYLFVCGAGQKRFGMVGVLLTPVAIVLTGVILMVFLLVFVLPIRLGTVAIIGFSIAYVVALLPLAFAVKRMR